jgi:hypothetical protein
MKPSASAALPVWTELEGPVVGTRVVWLLQQTSRFAEMKEARRPRRRTRH